MHNYLIGTLTNGNPVIFEIYKMLNGFPLTVWAKPLAGDGITVEYSYNGGASYQPPIVTNTLVDWYDSLLSGVTHIKFTRASGTGTTSTVGVC